MMDDLQALPVPASIVGESPLWHPTEHVLYWCDIVGRRLNRFDPASGKHHAWRFDSDVACCAPFRDGTLLLARRDGLWHFAPATGASALLCEPPYDSAVERFNDGKTGPDGAFWVGTIYEPRDQPAAALYRWADGALERIAGGVTVSNGLGWSPDGGTMYWSDTWGHTHYRVSATAPFTRQVLRNFPRRELGAPLDHYGGRPDGAAVDAEGCLWVAMFEGARLLRLSPNGEILRTLHLPVRCPTMPCFGGPDLRTLYITTARENRPPEELDAMPLSGHVLQLRVDVPGLPANFVN
ncbi:MAG: SMP-30/gluconolactonase/LRE family protein [Acidovorax sp.]